MKIRYDFITNSSSSSFIISKNDCLIEDWQCDCDGFECDCPEEKEINEEYINSVLEIAYKAINEINELKNSDYEDSPHSLEIIKTDSLTSEELEKFIEEYTCSFRYMCSNSCRRKIKETGYPDESGYIDREDYRRCKDENNNPNCRLIEDLMRESKFIINDFDSVPSEIHEFICECLKAKYFRFA